MPDTPEYVAWVKHRRAMLAGWPIVLLLLVAGLIQGVTWWIIVGSVGVVVGLLDYWFVLRHKPTG